MAHLSDDDATLRRKDSAQLESEYLELVTQLMSTGDEAGGGAEEKVTEEKEVEVVVTKPKTKVGKRSSRKKSEGNVKESRGRSEGLGPKVKHQRSSSTSSRRLPCVERENSMLDMFLTKQELLELQQKQDEERYRCFGVDLTALLQKERKRKDEQKHDPSVVPTVVQLVVERMREKQMNEEVGVFRMSGHHATLTALREKLDSCEPAAEHLADVDAFTLADLLKAFFMQLPTPVVPAYAYVHFHAAASHFLARPTGVTPEQDVVQKVEYGDRWRAYAAALIQSLPTASKALLRYILAFLSETAAKMEKNRMSADNLGTVFAPGVFGALCLPKPLAPSSSAPNVAKHGVAKGAKKSSVAESPPTALSPVQMVTDALNKATLLSLLISDWPLISEVETRPVQVFEATCSVVVSSQVEEYAASIGLPAFSAIKGDIFIVFGYANPKYVLVELRNVVGVMDVKAMAFMKKMFFHMTEDLHLGRHIRPFERNRVQRTTKAVGGSRIDLSSSNALSADPTKTSKKHKRSRSTLASMLLH